MPVTTRKRTANQTAPDNSFLPTALRTRLEKEKEEAAARAAFTSNFLSAPKDGESVEFRVMSECRWGYEVWYTEVIDGEKKNRVARWDALTLMDGGFDEPPAEEIPENCRTKKDGSPDVKLFNGMVVYNYGTEKFEIWSFTQQTIHQQFAAANSNPRFGDPRGYDFEWSRVGKEMTDTKHTLTALPPTDLDPEILQEYEEFECDLKAWAQGASADQIFGSSAEEE